MSPSTPVYAFPYPAQAANADVPNDMMALANRMEAVLAAWTSVPAGAGLDWYTTAAPSGFLLCDGSAVSRTTYAGLFAVLGTTWGTGDGSTTFNLPDCRGRVVVMYSSAGHADVATFAANDGLAVASRTPKHNSTFAGTAGNTGTVSADHTHNFSTGGVSANHYHPVNAQSYYLFVTTPDTGYQGYTGMASPGGPHFEGNAGVSPSTNWQNADHSHSGTTGGINTNHSHAFTPAGSVGPGGTRPVDMVAYVVANKIVKT